jgi:hypothetical protein
MTLDTQPRTEEAEWDPRPRRFTSLPVPKWSSVFQQYLGNGPGGYAYCIGHNGTVVDQGEWGYARMPRTRPMVTEFHSWSTAAAISPACLRR